MAMVYRLLVQRRRETITTKNHEMINTPLVDVLRRNSGWRMPPTPKSHIYLKTYIYIYIKQIWNSKKRIRWLYIFPYQRFPLTVLLCAEPNADDDARLASVQGPHFRPIFGHLSQRGQYGTDVTPATSPDDLQDKPIVEVCWVYLSNNKKYDSVLYNTELLQVVPIHPRETHRENLSYSLNLMPATEVARS